jgi:hypothetical protein
LGLAQGVAAAAAREIPADGEIGVLGDARALGGVKLQELVARFIAIPVATRMPSRPSTRPVHG